MARRLRDDGGTMTFVDLFCGMGTIRMGFEKAGHKCVYSIEFDKHKREIYKIIFGSEPNAGDIKTVRGSDIPISDCWCFGAPCQDFSIAGKRNGLQGDRSSLVREVFRLLGEIEEEHRPEWLLYENVKGMLSSNKGLDYLEILCEMGSLGYDCEWELLNSKDFGVPQNRERVYTLGHLRRYGSRKVFPLGSGNGKTDELQGQAIIANTVTARSGGAQSNGTYVFESERTAQVKQIGNVMPTATRDNPNQGRVYDPTGLAPCLNKMEGGGGQKDQNGRRFKEPGEPMFTLTKQDIHGVKIWGGLQAHQTPRTDGISPCINSAAGMGGGQTPVLTYGTRIRRLTPRECMRLQGVPDYITDKLIVAGISDTQIYRAAGDACTVNVIYEIAKRLEEQE